MLTDLRFLQFANADVSTHAYVLLDESVNVRFSIPVFAKAHSPTYVTLYVVFSSNGVMLFSFSQFSKDLSPKYVSFGCDLTVVKFAQSMKHDG